MTLFPTAEHLTRNEGHRHLEKTHLGQAHLAGTGPDNRTCRECKHWYCTRENSVGDRVPFHPYEGGDDASDAIEMQLPDCRQGSQARPTQRGSMPVV